MLNLFVCWVLFPLALTAVAVGCGLLLQWAAGVMLPRALLPAAGFAVVLVAGHIATATDAAAAAAVPVVVALALAGFVRALPLRRAVDWWAVAVGCAVFAVFAAPVVLSGESTFAGYIKLDDTATWLAMTDRLMEHGRDLGGLQPSSYEATLDVNLSVGYPVGAFPPLGIGAKLVGQDPAWVFQPYQALLAAYLGLALYTLTTRAIGSRALRAGAAIVASQAALLFAYSLWGGVKELAAAWGVALLGALLLPLLRERVSAFAVLPLAFASAALLAVLSFGGILWIAPMLIPAAIVLGRLRGAGIALAASGVYLICTAVLALPTLLQAEVFLKPASGTLTSDSELGNLIEPLSRLQLAGIWPAGDFRFEPNALGATYVLIAVVAAAGVLGLAWAWQRRTWELLVYVGAAACGALAISIVGSPWVGAKALATGSPAIVLAAAMGAMALASGGRRVEGGVLAVLIAAGILWSNALAYHEVNLAPRDRHQELADIGAEIADQGPTLMTEYEPYGVRHFLRKGDAEGASELRRRRIFLRTNPPREPSKLEFADLDQIALQNLLMYRTLVLRRSPVSSRPPAVYRRVRAGEYYDVWQRPPGSEGQVIDHLPLGDTEHATGRAPCSRVQLLAGLARTQGGVLAVARRPPPATADLSAPDGSDWRSDPAMRGAVIPRGAAHEQSELVAPAPARYDAFVRGSYRGRLAVSVDGRRIASGRHRLSHAGQYEPLGTVPLKTGRHEVSIDYATGVLAPGSGGQEAGLGPLMFVPRTAQAVQRLSPARARSLCGSTLDWVEAVTP